MVVNPKPTRMIDCNELYNKFNYFCKYFYCPNEILIIDCRSFSEYEEGHIINSIHMKSNDDELLIPYGKRIEIIPNIIIYDNNCEDIMLSKGGYEEFSARFPFMRTTKMIYTLCELSEIPSYPYEIIPNSLYIGNFEQATATYVQKNLRINVHVNCTNKIGSYISESENLLQLNISDSDEDIYSKIETCNNFIEIHLRQFHRILIFSDNGVGRSAIFVLGFLMNLYKISYE
ncbi:Dual specificity phosphatase inhibitor MK-STYX, partial [Intoshia linei]